jgi:transposase
MDIKVLGIDLGKTVCSLAGLDEAGAVVFRKRLQRHRLLDFLGTLPPCVVAMEACGGAHHIGRFCLENGHEPRLMSPLYVRPYVKVHKNDDRDAEAIAEAATRPTMSFVAIKSEEQLDLQALHRARERLVSERTRLINQGRGFLMERGIRVGTGRHVFQKELARLAEPRRVFRRLNCLSYANPRAVPVCGASCNADPPASALSRANSHQPAERLYRATSCA